MRTTVNIIYTKCTMVLERLMGKLGYKSKTQIAWEKYKETHPKEANAMIKRMIKMGTKPVSTGIYKEIERVRKTKPELYNSVMKKIAKRMVADFERSRSATSKT